MGRLLFVLPAVGAGDAVRLDTASGSSTPADLAPAGGGPAIPGGVLHAGVDGALPRVLGPADGTSTLYLKHLNYRGSVTGSPVTLTGIDLAAALSGNDTYVALPFTQAIGDGAATTYTVTHNRNRVAVSVVVRETTSGEVVYPTVTLRDVNTATVTFGSPPAAGFYTVEVF